MCNARNAVRWLVAMGIGMFLAVGALDLAAQGKGGTKGGKGGQGNLSVCVTFRDAAGDRVTSDGNRVYCDNSQGVQATVGLDLGGFRLATNNQGRLVSLDFSECLPGESCSPPFTKDLQDIDMRIGEEFVFDSTTGQREPTGQKLNILAMDGGETRFVELSINFSLGKGKSKQGYQVLFGRNTFAGVCPDGQGATIVRGGAPGASANAWTITAAANDVACMTQILDNFRQLNPVGRFHLPFSIDLAEQP